MKAIANNIPIKEEEDEANKEHDIQDTIATTRTNSESAGNRMKTKTPANIENKTKLEAFVGERTSSQLFIDEQKYVYQRNKRSRNGSYIVRCHSRSCNIWGSFSPETLILVKRGEHNHDPDLHYVNKCHFLQSIKQRALCEDEALRTIYNEEAARFDDIYLPSFSSVESCLQRIRRGSKVPNPTTFEEFVEVAEGSRVGFARQQNQFWVTSCPCNGESGNSIIFMSRGERQELFERAQAIFIDTTTRAAPLQFHHLLVIHVVILNQAIAVAFVLMEKNSEASYVSVLQAIKDHHPNFQPSIAVTNFEAELTGALSRIFPGISSNVSWFHYCQSLWRKCHMEGLQRYFKGTDVVKQVMKMAMAVPLLPPENIAEGLQIIRAKLNDLLGPVDQGLRNILNYIEVYWINFVTPQRLSVYRKYRRCNSCVEAFYISLRRKIPKPRPNFNFFLEKLLKINAEQEIKLRSLDNENSTQKEKLDKRNLNELKIRRHWELLRNCVVTVEGFLLLAMQTVPEALGEDDDEVEQRPDPELQLQQLHQKDLELQQQQQQLLQQQIMLQKQRLKLQQEKRRLQQQLGVISSVTAGKIAEAMAKKAADAVKEMEAVTAAATISNEGQQPFCHDII